MALPPPKVNPQLFEMVRSILVTALKPCADTLADMIQQEIDTPVQRNFTGQPVTRKEQGLGAGDPPRLDEGMLYTFIESSSEKTDYGARGVVTSSRPETPNVPELLEFRLDIPYMGTTLRQYRPKFAGQLTTELRKILK